MQELGDNELLRSYVEQTSEEAFALLVQRYINRVYSVALRHVRSPHQAEEITQAVFIILAQKAPKLIKHVCLSGWLYQTARLTSVTFLRSEIRRSQREEAYLQSEMSPSESEAWQHIEPLLDNALAGLGEKERNAIVLRFFDSKSMKEVGDALEVNEDAAKKRVNRGLEKMRKFFTKHGYASTTTLIAGALTANSVQAAPMALAKIVSTVAITKGAAAGGSTLPLVKGALKIMAWTKAKIAIVATVSVLMAAGTATLTVEKIQDHQNDKWQLVDERMTYKLLEKPPYLTRILPTKASRRIGPSRAGCSTSLEGGKILTINASLKDILLVAYVTDGSVNPCRAILKIPINTNKFDFISNQERNSKQALAKEIERKFGLVGRFETIETNVLFLRVKTPNSPGLKPKSTKISSDYWPGAMSVAGMNMTKLATTLENYSEGIPVIDQTGLTKEFEFEVDWYKYSLKEGEKYATPNLEGLKQALVNEVGLELVPAIAPVAILIVERAKK